MNKLGLQPQGSMSAEGTPSMLKTCFLPRLVQVLLLNGMRYLFGSNNMALGDVKSLVFISKPVWEMLSTEERAFDVDRRGLLSFERQGRHHHVKSNR